MTRGQERREHLKEYILACLRDGALSWSDLASLTIFDKLLKIISRDGKVVFGELKREGTAGLLRMGVTVLAGLAENAVRKR